MLAPYIQPNKVLQVITIDRALEDMLTKNIKHTEHGSYLAIDPQTVEQVVNALSAEVEKQISMDVSGYVFSCITLIHFRKTYRTCPAFSFGISC